MSYSSKKYGINVEFHPSFAGDKDAAMRALDKTLDYIGSGDPSSKQALVTFLKNIKKNGNPIYITDGDSYTDVQSTPNGNVGIIVHNPFRTYPTLDKNGNITGIVSSASIMRHEMEHVNEHIQDINNPNRVGPGTDGDNNPDDDKSDGVFDRDNAIEVEARRAANELRAFYGEPQRLDLRNLDVRHPIAVTDPTFSLNVSPIFDLLKSGFNAISISNWLGLLREMFFHQIDPLTLDLNGNGIETLAANGHDGAMFDHERLGIRTATGWVHGNDGILVYDRNGDGKINDGGEIFGDNTLLKNGKTAAHGFEAAADLDDNGDGKLDAADSAFSKLGVWRDLNHNGISEEGEIFALKDLRIKSLNLGYTQADKDLGNGNTLAEVGSYTDEDGNEHIMGDLRLSADRLHSRYSNSIPLTDEQQQEVNLRGSGRLRDLREAAAQSSELAEVLQQYKNAATKEEQLALRHKLLKAWADTDPQRIEDFKSTMKTMIQNEERKGIGLTPSQVKHMGEMVVMNFWVLIGQPDPERQKQAKLKRRTAILDAFTGPRSPNLYYFNEA